VSDINKQTENVHADGEHAEDVMDSDELFDLDLPLDEPEETQDEAEADIQTAADESKSSDVSDSLQDLMDAFPDDNRQERKDKTPEDEQETLFTVEQDLEHLLDRNEAAGEQTREQEVQPAPEAFDTGSIDTGSINTDANPASADVSTPSEIEPMAAAPAAETSKAKPRVSMAGSFMLTLGLIAILIVSLAAWFGLDAAQQKSNLAAVASDLQQQIKLLKQQHEQQKTLLKQHIDTLEKRLNTLTQVVTASTSEQWRSSLQQKPQVHARQPAATSMKAAPPKPEKTNIQAGGEKKPPAGKKTITPAKPVIEVKKVPAASVKPVAKPPATPAQLSMYEVAPGTVKGWVVNIFSVTSRSTAERKIRQLKAKDIHAKYVRVKVKGKIWYRVRVSGFKDKRAAVTFKKFLQEYQGIDAWAAYLK